VTPEEIAEKIEQADKAITGTVLARVETDIAKAIVNLKAASQNMLADYKRQSVLLEEARKGLRDIVSERRHDPTGPVCTIAKPLLSKLEDQP
jgi:chorismate mutase